MANYKETNVSGAQWQRCTAIHIQNEYGQVPQINLIEEQVTVVGDTQFKKHVGMLSVVFDPDAVIQLLNPADGTPLGQSMTQSQIHVALWSLYTHAAKARDELPATERP